MVILPSNRQTAVQVTPDDPRCQAIVQRYGSAENLYLQVMSGKPKADTPTLVMCIRTYGEDIIQRQIASRMKMCVMTMGETSMDDIDATVIARGINEDSTARTLGYDLVMEFFRRLERSEYELYACKPRNIMAAWQQFARYATSLQTRMKEAEDHDRREAERQQHEKRYLRPEEFRRWKEQWTSQQSS